MNLAPVRGSYLESYCGASPTNDMRPLQVGYSKSKKIKVGKEASAPSQRRFALARIIVCCGASIVAHFARKVRATNT